MYGLAEIKGMNKKDKAQPLKEAATQYHQQGELFKLVKEYNDGWLSYSSFCKQVRDIVEKRPERALFKIFGKWITY